MPTCGYRNIGTGEVYRIGSEGQSWSSTAPTLVNGHFFEVGSTWIYPQHSNYRFNAFPVRCIRCRGHTEIQARSAFTLPYADFAELYGSTVQDGNPNGIKRLGAFALGSYTPLSGYAFGPNRNNVTLSGNTRVTNADPNTDGAMFVPTDGYRHAGDKGAVYCIGLAGYNWSSTASTSGNAHHLVFYPTTIYPQFSDFRSYGFPVRCIRD